MLFLVILAYSFRLLFPLLLLSNVCKGGWEEWWTYDGISGPSFWGLINPKWSLCNKGRRQSPVNVDPSKLLFDPNLRLLHVDKHRVSGNLTNTGHSIIFTVDPQTREPVNITEGPLSYRYQFHEIHLHYGTKDTVGSEHTIDGYAFPAEIQIFGFNSQLYSNVSEALTRSQGIVGIAMLLQLGGLSNPELRLLTNQLPKIKYSGQQASVRHLSIRSLLPDTDFYMTYEGSTTMPGCYETVTWIIKNKPIYITKQQLHGLRELMQGDNEMPTAPLGNNFRPPLALHHRPLRTNIDFRRQGAPFSQQVNLKLL
ncbi:hypothetical protein CHUAL_000802 [Chamberlinius hualienensis]